nr:hypothetical protein [uncultured Agathobaculum sp.]
MSIIIFQKCKINGNRHGTMASAPLGGSWCGGALRLGAAANICRVRTKARSAGRSCCRIPHCRKNGKALRWAAAKKKAVRSDSFFPKESEYKKEKRGLGSVKIKRNGAPRGRQALQGAGFDSIAPRGMDAAGIGLRRAEGRMVCASAFGLTLRFVVGLLAFDDSIIAILDKNAR